MDQVLCGGGGGREGARGLGFGGTACMLCECLRVAWGPRDWVLSSLGEPWRPGSHVPPRYSAHSHRQEWEKLPTPVPTSVSLFVRGEMLSVEV